MPSTFLDFVARGEIVEAGEIGGANNEAFFDIDEAGDADADAAQSAVGDAIAHFVDGCYDFADHL